MAERCALHELPQKPDIKSLIQPAQAGIRVSSLTHLIPTSEDMQWGDRRPEQGALIASWAVQPGPVPPPPIWTSGGDPGPHEGGYRDTVGESEGTTREESWCSDSPKLADTAHVHCPTNDNNDILAKLDRLFDAFWHKL
ncbi:Hypothetical predicted protein [Pelobates cultripes]|uniref:Uncharacterized protein n=1 Tax=Pelobates cultripes TaxID=61616 RepID=A0AAD1RTE5_PELCU|nr:Hypothetical predicted protein [Pelobates cultripes]